MMMMGKKENKSKDGPDMKSLPALNSFEKASIKYEALMAFVQTGREEGIWSANQSPSQLYQVKTFVPVMKPRIACTIS